ncbi:alpha-protein kinase 1-like [Lucilia sericata]|uniref:alpha-protein kinase 1-like n=1 Tax=Lucilia sericata TaxID=13632 RepID=UPI0018A803C5|nr:alpha-protein kinase 1-like [Lucilia sericata]
MGQSLSIRRPRISLTWVLREQSQNQQQQQQQQNEPQQQQNTKKEEETKLNEEKKENISDLNNVLNNNQILNQRSSNKQDHTTAVEKKKYRLKHIPNSNSEALNGYATTPTGYTNTPNALGSQKFFSNQNLLEYHKDESNCKPASKDLLFVCTPQRVPESFGGSSLDVLALAKKRNEIRKKLATKMAHFRSESQTPRLVNNISNDVQLKKDNKSSLKSGSYSEPSLIAASEGNSRRHRHRKRRERNRSQKFGYEIKNVDEFLNKCSLASPGNIPMVLSTSCILYQTRPGGYQTEISLPLGMVVNAVFKNHNWLYVQTPHAEEGYVNYTTCLPLGILPPEARKESKPTPCWETNGDIFPKPCGNMTDSEKEIHLRVGSRSEGARTPHLKNAATDNDTATVISVKTENTDCLNGNATTTTSSIYGEQQVDKLYLRAASQPKLNDKTSYAQLKIIRNHSSAKSQSSAHTNDEYVTLQQKQQHHQQQSQPHQIKQKHVHTTNQPIQKTYITRTFITNGHNGQHLHPKDMKTNLQQQQQLLQPTNCNLKTSNSTTMLQQQQQQLQQNNAPATITVTSYPNNKHQLQTPPQQQQQQLPHQSQSSLQHNQQQHTFVAPRSVLNAIRRSTAHCGQRQTLVAITTDYSTDALTLHKGDIVTLCECRETKDHRQWFYVRTRDGRQGYIPAEVAGHGYL